ncbi:MAG: hypothetical protein R2739_00230 [Chitinophagales bacterium]|nr:hypothetical protein [Bacteroidota bacterium]
MRKVFSVLTIFLLFGFSGCKLIDKLTQFNISYSTDFSIPATSIISLPIPIPDIVQPADISTNTTQTFENNNTHADLLEKVALKKLKLTITNPSSRKFDFLKSAYVYISADGLPEVKVAYIEEIDDATVGNSIELTPEDQDLQEYLKKDKITIRVEATADKTTNSETDIKVDATFFVDAKILGV